MNNAPGPAAKSAPLVLPALALWGWQTELLPWALGMGVLLEAARFSKTCLDLRLEDFNRLWNFTSLLFLGVALYLFLARQGLSTVGTMVATDVPGGRLEGVRQLSQTAITFVRGMPFVFYPFMLIHAWSRTASLPWSVFSLYLRSQAARTMVGGTSPPPASPVHPGYLYLGIVLFSSTAATGHPLAYLPLLAGVIALALWPWRNRRFRAPAWIGLLLAMLAVSLLVQAGMGALRSAWQALENRLMQRAAGGGFDQLRSFTALGAVGDLKRSSRIVLRIDTDGRAAPGLLREAAFNRFRNHTWSTSHREFQAVPATLEGVLWWLSAPRGGAGSMTISRYTTQGEAPLALPDDTLAIRHLAATIVETNHLAAARLRDGPPLALYTIEHGPGGGFDGAPVPDDTSLENLGTADREIIATVADELGLERLKPADAVTVVERFFAAGFAYSLWQGALPARTNASALAVFLRETRTGHCEYFATATTLLLRTAGVPTRYAVGYSPEPREGNRWLARGRDAHAWCLAYLGGRWRVVDTTPGVWRERESARAPWWEGVTDTFSQAWYRFAVWRQQGGNWQVIVFGVSMALLAWLGWRQLRGSRWRRVAGLLPSAIKVSPPPGMDSEFFACIRRLEALHGPRPPHETLRAWLTRLPGMAGSEARPLREALQLHYRLRFDPAGLAPADRARLRELARELVNALSQKRPAGGT